jgi:uncharacterized protein YfiM (DUF2279 family)
MEPAAVLLSSFVAIRRIGIFFSSGGRKKKTLASRLCSLFSILLVSCFLQTNIYAQDTIINKDTAISSDQLELSVGWGGGNPHTTGVIFNNFSIKNILPNTKWDLLDTSSGKILSNEQRKKRTLLMTSANVVGYGGIMTALASAWYEKYTKTKLHSFNDSREWQQMDKVGHYYGTWIESRANNELWKWTGMNRKKRIWISGLTSVAFQSTIEVLDGYSAEWGFSWSDFTANLLGSGTFIAQELAWDDQRIKLKWSFHKKNYSDASLNQRSDILFGKSTAERFLKDYNGQTYWASVNLKSFFPKSNLPKWLAVSFGYGAEGMFGGEENIAKDANGNITFDRRDIKRYRQWYLAPDIDLSKIKTKSKAVHFMLMVFSAFKFPAPSLEFSNGKFRLNAIHF